MIRGVKSFEDAIGFRRDNFLGLIASDSLSKRPLMEKCPQENAYIDNHPTIKDCVGNK